MSTRPEKLMVLDTASLYFRAYFGVPDTVRAPDGTPVNAVRGLLDFITRLVTDHSPTHLIACWDEDWRPQWRVDLLPSYKAHRVEETVSGGADVEEVPGPLETQVPIIAEVLDALGIAVLGAPAAEADDVIGTVVAGATSPVDVVTGDRDLFQLVDDARGVRVLYTARGVGNLVTVDEAYVQDKYGVPARSYVDFAVLRGDPSDGLPGVAGVGEKTAASLLTRHSDLASVVAAAHEDGSGMSATLRRKIAEAADYLTVAPQVVQVVGDVPLPRADTTLPAQPRNPNSWEELVHTWGLGSAAKRVVDALAATRM